VEVDPATGPFIRDGPHSGRQPESVHHHAELSQRALAGPTSCGTVGLVRVFVIVMSLALARTGSVEVEHGAQADRG
jgi:hypothetical protein